MHSIYPAASPRPYTQTRPNRTGIVARMLTEPRQRIGDIDRLYVRSTAGALVPLRSLTTVTCAGPPMRSPATISIRR
jgi:multidrug efflux pump subunit AcrB